MTWISIYFDDENVSGMKVWKYYILSNTCFPVTLGKEKHTSSLPTPPAILFSTTDNHSWYVTTYVAMIPHCQWSLYPAFTAANDGEDGATVYTYCTYLTLQWRVGDYTGQVEQILPPRSDNKFPIWYEIVTFINRVYLHNPGVKYCRVCSHLHFHPILGCCCTEYQHGEPTWKIIGFKVYSGAIDTRRRYSYLIDGIIFHIISTLAPILSNPRLRPICHRGGQVHSSGKI